MLRLAITSLQILLIGIALLIGLARLALPQISGYEEQISAAISESVGRPVTIAGIEARWTHLNPEFHLQDVSLLDPETRQPLITLQRVATTVDIWRSLKTARPRLSTLAVANAELDFYRDTQGTVSLRGIDSGAVGQGGSAAALLTGLQFNLVSSTLRLHDASLDRVYQFSDVNLVFHSRNDSHRIAAQADLPEGLGESLKLGVHWQGAVENIKSLDGQLYVKASQWQLNNIPDNYLNTKVDLKSGVLDAEGWSEWQDGSPQQWSGSVDLNNLHVVSNDSAVEDDQNTETALKALHSRIRWQRSDTGWLLDVADMRVVSESEEWPASGLNLEVSRSSNSNHIRAGVDYLQLADLTPYVAMLKPDHALVHAIDRFNPSATITDLRLTTTQQAGEPLFYSASGVFNALQFDAAEKIPGAAGLRGKFIIDELSGEAVVESDALVLNYPEMFDKELQADSLSARLRWLQTQDGITVLADRFLLNNPDISLRGNLGMTLEGESPYVEVQLAILEGKGSNAGDYVPKLLKPKTREWLKNGILEGAIKSGTVMFKGQPRDFPFYRDEGQFTMSLSVDDGKLNYHQDWPLISDISGELSMQNESLQFIASQGTVLNTQIQSAQVRISDIKRANLNISGKTHGPLADLQDYLIKSSRISGEGVVARDIALSGPADLELDLVLPVTKIADARAERAIRGKLKLEDAGLLYSRLDLDFTEISGEFDFDLYGATANNVTAVLRQRPVTIKARSGPAGRTELRVAGNFSPQTFFTDDKPPLIDKIQGSSDWNAVLDLPAIKKEQADKSVGFKLQSSLEGIAINLPAPFNKAMEDANTLSIATRFEKNRRHPVKIDYGEEVSSLMLLNREHQGSLIERAELRVNRGQAELPEEGLAVLATLNEFSTSKWLHALDQAATDGAGELSVNNSGLPLKHVDIDVAQLELSGLNLKNFKMDAIREPEAWKLNLDAPVIKGRVEIPHERSEDQPVIAALDHLMIDPEEFAQSEKRRLNPESIPAIRLSSHELRYRDFKFTDVSMQTAPLVDGARLHYLKLKGTEFSGKVNGVWRHFDDAQRSKFNFELKSEDIGKTLESWKIDNSFSEGVAEISAKMNWPYAPHQFDFDGLMGIAKIDIKDGRLKKVKQGAARLLGLFNISTIQRRLSLNFKDIFKKGFVFDSIEGDLRIEDSDVYTDNLKMVGPSALVRIEGRTGLLARDYDQTIKVNPELSVGLPLAGTLVGGPALGAAVLVAEKIGEQFGQDVDKLVTLEYKVTGPWDKPEITEIKKEPEHSFAPDTSTPVK